MKLQNVKLLVKDVRQIDRMKLHKTEPRWSVIERILNKVDKR